MALGVLYRIEIVIRYYLSSPGPSRLPTSCRNIIQGRNPSWSKSPSHTRSPIGKTVIMQFRLH